MSVLEQVSPQRDRRRDRVLVFGALFGPCAWAAFIVVTYMLEDPLACTPGASVHGQILGLGVRAIATGVILVLGGATLAVGLLSLVLWRRLRYGNSTGRPAWMALAGLLNSLLFGSVILVGLAPSFFLRTCSP